MSGISKRVSGSWVSGDYGIMKTSTDIITTLPAVIYADGNNATVGISGNLVQTGTPIPQNPIQPSECGERTENLFNYQSVAKGKYIDSNGVEQTTSSSGHEILNHSGAIAVSPNTAYTFKIRKAEGARALTNAFCWFDTNNQIISRDMAEFAEQLIYIKMTFTAPANAKYLIINFRDNYYDTGMVVEGSTAPSVYIPYGYKIPISSASTTTPVYLGEVESTRLIRELVLTGYEGWKNLTSDNTRFYLDVITPDYIRADSQITYMCTHYIPYEQTTSALLVPNLNMSMSSVPAQRLYITDSNYTSVDDFKSYLAQQYANGTPVTVWYVLATEETGIVNEPIRKIGDYADTVSGISIPTIAGANSFDVLTTLKPSEITVNYKGWHPVADVHERDSGAWT